jgi:hypothetical protein
MCYPFRSFGGRKMAITERCSVRILKPDDVTIGTMINHFREWLDAHSISALLIKSGVEQDGSIVFELTFGVADHAELFNRQFG